MITTTSTHTWESLLAAVPAPTQEEVQIFALKTPNVDLIEWGSHIRSDKVRKDMVRMLGKAAAFWAKATDAHRDELLGFSDGLLRVAVHSGKALGDLLNQHEESTDGREASREAAITAAAESYQKGMSERKRLSSALEGAVADDSILSSRLASARGRVTDAKSLSSSLGALTSLSREILADPSSIPAKRLTAGGVIEKVLQKFDAIAAEVKSTGERSAGARQTGAVSKADLDLQDGICLTYLEQIMRLFNQANARDPSIPKLVPIATRSLLAPTRKRSEEVPEPGPEDLAEAEAIEAAEAASKKKPS